MAKLYQFRSRKTGETFVAEIRGRQGLNLIAVDPETGEERIISLLEFIVTALPLLQAIIDFFKRNWPKKAGTK